jgi:hypothetical protein
MLKKITFTDKSVPIIILLPMIGAFGLLIPWLGYYWDDWPVIFMYERLGVAGYWDFYQYDRPFSAWTYILSAPVLGTNPIPWHIFSLLLRWGTAVALWAVLRTVWPGKARQTLWIGLLFAIFPVFNQQAVAVAYSQHWICYLFFFLSVLFMLLALEQAKRFYLYTVIALFFSAMNLFTMEYFIGLELLRPFIIWLYLNSRNSTLAGMDAFKQSARSSGLYLALFAFYIYWRVNVLELAGNDPNQLNMLGDFLHSPFQAAIDLAQMALQDLVYFLTSWTTIINPANVDLRRPFFLGSVLVVILVIGTMWFILDRYQVKILPNLEEEKWHAQVILIGFAAILFGTLPVWLIGRQASAGLYGSRFGLAAMFGLSVVTVGVLEWLSANTRAKNVVVSLLVGMAVFFHLYSGKTFQDSWEKQRKVYWQLYWRMPYLQPGTAVISDGEIFINVGRYSTAMGISLLYPPSYPVQQMPYWFFSMGEGLFNRQAQLLSGMTLEGDIRNYWFQGDSKNAVLIYLPGPNYCAQVLSAADRSDRDIPDLLREVAGLSNRERILPEPVEGWSPPVSIFGAEPEHGWCYYFEKAELARQNQEWDLIIQFMEEAAGQDLTPYDVKEYLPWLDAFLHTERIEEAYLLTVRMKRFSDVIDDQMCTIWRQAALDNQASDEINAAYQKVNEKLSCFD